MFTCCCYLSYKILLIAMIFFQIVEWELELLRKKRDEFNALVAGKAKNIEFRQGFSSIGFV